MFKIIDYSRGRSTRLLLNTVAPPVAAWWRLLRVPRKKLNRRSRGSCFSHLKSTARTCRRPSTARRFNHSSVHYIHHLFIKESVTTSSSQEKPIHFQPSVATPAPALTLGPGPRSYVALLKEMCEEYRLPGVEYELVSDTGPPHMRQFAMRASLGQHSRLATATTKKAARQLAAQQLYSYLRDNLSRLTADFVEVGYRCYMYSH